MTKTTRLRARLRVGWCASAWAGGFAGCKADHYHTPPPHPGWHCTSTARAVSLKYGGGFKAATSLGTQQQGRRTLPCGDYGASAVPASHFRRQRGCAAFVKHSSLAPDAHRDHCCCDVGDSTCTLGLMSRRPKPRSLSDFAVTSCNCISALSPIAPTHTHTHTRAHARTHPPTHTQTDTQTHTQYCNTGDGRIPFAITLTVSQLPTTRAFCLV